MYYCVGCGSELWRSLPKPILDPQPTRYEYDWHCTLERCIHYLVDISEETLFLLEKEEDELSDWWN